MLQGQQDLLEKTAYSSFRTAGSLWILINEILIRETTISNVPKKRLGFLIAGHILDWRSTISRVSIQISVITGFEPVAELREMALENVRSNGFENVDILPYALTDKHGTVDFYKSTSDSMAGSVTDRRSVAGDETEKTEVETRTLSEFWMNPWIS